MRHAPLILLFYYINNKFSVLLLGDSSPPSVCRLWGPLWVSVLPSNDRSPCFLPFPNFFHPFFFVFLIHLPVRLQSARSKMG